MKSALLPLSKQTADKGVCQIIYEFFTETALCRPIAAHFWKNNEMLRRIADGKIANKQNGSNILSSISR